MEEKNIPTYRSKARVTKQEWEAIQASLSVDLREDEPGYDEDIINKYDLRPGTNPITITFEFENGMKISMNWYVEEFGGIIVWSDIETYDDFSHEYDLVQETEHILYTADDKSDAVRYICEIEIMEE